MYSYICTACRRKSYSDAGWDDLRDKRCDYPGCDGLIIPLEAIHITEVQDSPKRLNTVCFIKKYAIPAALFLVLVLSVMALGIWYPGEEPPPIRTPAVTAAPPATASPELLPKPTPTSPPSPTPEPTSRYSPITEAERELIARAVWHEARGESAEGQQAVAEVILNRVAADNFPGTVEEVIHQAGQFASARYIDSAEPGQAQYDAIDAALTSDNILPLDVVYFSARGENDRVWGEIGGHIFCYQYVWG